MFTPSIRNKVVDLLLGALALCLPCHGVWHRAETPATGGTPGRTSTVSGAGGSADSDALATVPL